MKTVPANTEVYVWQGPADMRAGFERLASLVQEHMQRSVLGGGVYMFVSRCKMRVKLLYWDNMDMLCGTSGLRQERFGWSTALELK